MKFQLFNSLVSRLFWLNLGAFIIVLCSMPAVVIAGERNVYNIIEVAKADVEAQGCSYLGEVWGVSKGKLSKWNHLSVNSSLHKAEDKALRKAAELNATHLVWNGHAGGFDGAQEVHADAYRCESVAKPSDIAKKTSDSGNQIN